MKKIITSMASGLGPIGFIGMIKSWPQLIFMCTLAFTTPIAAQSLPGNALDFDGTNDYVAIPPAALNNLSTGTFETWLYPNSNLEGTVLMKQCEDIGTHAALTIGYFVTSGSTPQTGVRGKIYYRSQNSGTLLTSNTILQEGHWYHIALTFSATSASLYINGILDATETGGNFTIPDVLVSDSPINTTIGTWITTNTPQQRLNGRLDELRIFNTDRSANIAADMLTSIPGNTSGLTAYYRCNQGTAGEDNKTTTLLEDNSEMAANNGTLTNFSLSGATSNFVESYAMVVPTALDATNISMGDFTANWAPPAIGVADHYLVDVATDAAFTNMAYTKLSVDGINTSLPITGLSPATTYYYRVAADKTTLTGEGGYSNTIMAATKAPPQTPPGNALHFDGNSYVKAPMVRFPNGEPNIYVIEAWIKPEGTGTFNILTIGQTGNPVQSDLFSISIAGSAFRINLKNEFFDNVYLTSFASRAIVLNHWNRIAIVCEPLSATMSMFVNGVWVTIHSDVIPSQDFLYYDQNTYILLGKSGNVLNGNPFIGSMDEVKIWRGPRSTEQIEADFSTTVFPDATNLAAYFNFDNQGIAGADNTGNPAASQLTDLSGHFAGTLYNFGLTGNTDNWVESYAMTWVTATPATNVTAGGFTANWTAPTGPGLVEGYKVTVATDALFANIVPAYEGLPAPANATSLAITGLQPNTQYYYRVWPDKASVVGQGASSLPVAAVKTIGSPIITSFTPTYGTTGQQLLIYGSYFTGATAVTIGSTTIPSSAFTVVSDNEITLVIGNGSTGNITVTTPLGTGSSANVFTFIRPLLITSISPASGNTGTVVTIAGQGFTHATAVRFGGTAPSSFTVVDDETITAVIAVGTTGDVTVTNTTDYTLPNAFTYIPPSPIITGISPASGSIGTAVTITGSNFTGTTALSLGGVLVSNFTVVSNTQITAVVGTGASGDVTVVNGLTYTLPSAFTYIPGPAAPGNALQFDGVDDYVSISGGLGTFYYTLEFWMKTTAIESELIDNGPGAYTVFMSAGYLYLRYGYGVTHEIYTPQRVNTGQWVHVAVTINAPDGYTKIFINGVLAAQLNTGVGHAVVGTQPYITLGGNWPTDDYAGGGFKGSIDELRILAGDRSAAIAADMLTSSPAGATILSSYHFDQGMPGGNNATQTTLVDAGTKNLIGILHNFALNGPTSNWVGSYAMATPVALAASNIKSNGFTANWAKPVVGIADSFKITLATDTAFYQILPGYNGISVAGTATSLPITGLAPNTTYYYGVQSYIATADGQGNYSNAIQAVTTAAQQTPPGNALHFDGNSYVTAPMTSFLAPSSGPEFTIEAWIKPEATDAEYNILSIGHTGMDPLYGASFSLSFSGGYFTVSVQNLGNVRFVKKVQFLLAPMAPNHWNRVVVTCDGSILALFVNGVRVKAVLGTDVMGILEGLFINGLDTYISLGKSVVPAYGSPFIGSMDEVKIFTSLRTLDQMESDFYTIDPNSGYAAYYNFDNQGIAGADNTGSPTASQLTDLAGHFPGTLYGFGLKGNAGNWVESYAMTWPTAAPATNISPTSFTANWAAPALPLLDGYKVAVATDSLFAQIVPGYDSLPAPPTATSLAITGLQPGTKYYYRIRADKTSVMGQGAFSIAIPVKTIGVPVITSFTPAYGYTGQLVSINGSNFTAATAVTIGGTPPTAYTFVNDNLITVELGTGNTGIIAITTPAGTGYSADAFTLMRPLLVTGVSPATGNTGTVVTIKGQGFLYATAVRFGGTAPSSFTVVDDEIITAVIAAGATGGVTVTNTTDYTLPNAFTYLPPSPVITAISPASGTIGTEVTITGSNFTGTTVLTLGGAPVASFNVVNDTQITAIIGTGATGDVTVTNGLAYTLPSAFTYISSGLAAPGNAMLFDGVDDYVQIAGNPITASFTIEFWIKTSQTTDASLIDASANNTRDYIIYMSDGRLYVRMGNLLINSSSSVNTGHWMHVAISKNTGGSGMLKLYINSLLEAQTSFTSALVFNNSPIVTLGRRTADQAVYFNGAMDELRFIATDRGAVIAADMATDSPAGATISSSYHFDQGTPGGNNANQTTLVDAGSRNLAGTLYNFALTGNTSNWVESYAMAVPKASGVTNVGGTSVTVNWTAPALGTVNRYYVDVADNYAVLFNTLTVYSNILVDGSSASLQITGLSPNTNYKYRIRADKTSVAGDGCYSNVITFATGNCTVADRMAVNAAIGISSIASGQAILLMVNGSSCAEVATIVSNGSEPLSGTITAKVWVNADQPAEFVKRHYEITPDTKPSTATGKVTLYFTQQEFDDFNEANSTQLPKNPSDIEGNIPNLRIEKRTGISSDGTGQPNTYPAGTPQTFAPSTANGSVIWNGTASRWEVSFEVTGFSGFFVKTQSTPLPLRLIGFSGTQETTANKLRWQTADEVNTQSFEVQSSKDGRNFQKIATIDAVSAGNNSYDYTDANAYKGIMYYRLKMIDVDGKFTYSRILSLGRHGKGALNVYPNPVTDRLAMSLDNSLINSEARLYDVSGKLVQTIKITLGEQPFDVKTLPTGVYIIKFKDGSSGLFLKE